MEVFITYVCSDSLGPVIGLPVMSNYSCIFLSFSGVSFTAWKMDIFFRGVREESMPSQLDILKCPFLRNIDEPTNFSFASTMPFTMPVSYILHFADLSLLSNCCLHVAFFQITLSSLDYSFNRN